MTTNATQIDPTDPVFSHSHLDENEDLDRVKQQFQRASEHFPLFLDVTTTLQIVNDISAMADIRFTALFDEVREDIVAAAKQYDDAHPEIKKHQPDGSSALPNWEAVIGLKLDKDLVVDDATAVNRVKENGLAQQANTILNGHRPVIDDAALTAMYHTYQGEGEEKELVCSHIDPELTEYDYFIFMLGADLQSLNAPALYDLETDSYRDYLAQVLKAKADFLCTVDQTRDIDSLFEMYISPLVHTFDDFTRLSETSQH